MNKDVDMLSWKLMKATETLAKATEEACQCVCMQEEASEHYGEPYTMWDRWQVWWRGFATGLSSTSQGETR